MFADQNGHSFEGQHVKQYNVPSNGIRPYGAVKVLDHHLDQSDAVLLGHALPGPAESS